MKVLRAAIRARLAGVDWAAAEASLFERGFATLPRLLSDAECDAQQKLYDDTRRFRKTVDMARHHFGEGEYKYFADPLPPLVAALRAETYRRVAPIANAMERALRRPAAEPRDGARWPTSLVALRKLCAAAGQPRPTPLLLRYTAGGYNCLHRDLYGPLVFPLQLAVFLSEPGRDYEGGAFLLVEQRPRQQSVGEALLLGRGEAVLFATADRPRRGTRGFHRAAMRHGVATVTRGERFTLGVIFHDAKS
jgi:hypothetical protein